MFWMSAHVLMGKAFGMVSLQPFSQSISNLSGFGANHHLRQSLTFLNMPVVEQPEVYLANSQYLLDDSGKFKIGDTVQFLQSFVDAFVDLMKKQTA